MADWQITVIWIYGVVVLLALSRHFLLSYELKRTPRLTPQSPRFDAADAPLVSVMIPAKDEAANIERCLASVLAQDYANFEVLVVDDRSEDATAEIVSRIAATDGRVQLVQIHNLPEGWTGKTHALDVCRRRARGEWYFFVDADTQLDPSCLSVTLKDAVDHDAGMESLIPRLDGRSFWERVIQPMAGTVLMTMFRPSTVNNPKCETAGFANGQFILISRDGYEQIGGHEAVRNRFVEDIQLGRNARRGGLGLRLAFAADVASVRMYSSLGQIVRGWSRILYSAADAGPIKLGLIALAVLVLSLTPYAILAVGGTALAAGAGGTFLWTLLGMAALHTVLQLTLHGRTYAVSNSDARFLAFHWLANSVILYILLRTVRMCWTHKVEWRGTTYGAEMLTASTDDSQPPSNDAAADEAREPERVAASS